ncbi:MAG: hypothetical protein HFH40_07700 [Lachnospiraceae bacterium]|nr:hypothetical protein [Lachnospiraceae bacterium]
MKPLVFWDFMQLIPGITGMYKIAKGLSQRYRSLYVGFSYMFQGWKRECIVIWLIF